VFPRDYNLLYKTTCGKLNRRSEMIKDNIQKAINEQINAEMFSSYLYLSMAAYLDSVNLDGAAHWMELQSKEEMGHAMKLYKYLQERGGKVQLMGMEDPKQEWESLLEVFEDAYKHELYITDRINKMVDLAMAENDHATLNMLQWFVDEQVEEEANADKIVQRLRMIGDHVQAIFMMDRALAQRD
jgi:ferritin